MDAIPAWLVALVGMVAAWAVLAARAMPLPFRIALAAPRLAFALIYAVYALFDMDIANRMAITRFLLLILFCTEALAALFVRRVSHWGSHDRV